MSNRLVLLLGDFHGTETRTASVLEEWSSAGLLDVVAWCDTSTSPTSKPKVRLSSQSTTIDVDLFELLVSRIWDHVSVVALREGVLGELDSARFEAETRLLQLIEDAFAEHRSLGFNCMTVSIAETNGLREEAFAPQWRLNILQEPIVRIDDKVAAQPLHEGERSLLVLLLGLTSSGGFVWQSLPLVSDLVDPVIGNTRPLRVGRAYLRVVSAGRLTDEILSGAFPASGPWSVPSDVANAWAATPGSIIGDEVLDAIKKIGVFSNRAWKPDKDEKKIKHGILDGLKLFFKEFIGALKSIPYSIVSKIKNEMEAWVTKVTFGNDSSVLLKFNPKEDILDLDNMFESIKGLDLAVAIDPIGDPLPWQVLQQVALGAVDGGRFPNKVPAPMAGSNRLIFTDPVAIGPSPDASSFAITKFEIVLLGLPDGMTEIAPMDVEGAYALQTRLNALREELADASLSAGTSKQQETTSKKKAEDSSEIALKKTSRKQRRLAKKAAKKQTKLEKKRRKQGIPVKNTPQVVAGLKVPEVPTAVSEEKSIVDVGTGEDVVEESSTSEEKLSDVASSPIDDTGRHRPSHKDFKSVDYIALCSFYQGDRDELISEYSDIRNVYEAAIQSHQPVKGFWNINKSCDHCGTLFDHGVLYLHEPTGQLVHVGHICARKSLSVPNETDLVQKKLSELEKRWTGWLQGRRGSLLWRVGNFVIGGLVISRGNLARLVAFIMTQQSVEQKASEAQITFGKWTRRGLLFFVLLIAVSMASIILTPLPLIIFVITTAVYFSGFTVKIFLLARELVRAQFRMQDTMTKYELAYRQARFEITELVRLGSVLEQFQDWQVIIRQLVHIPFGREIGFNTSSAGIGDVKRAPAMILGTSQPNDKQKMHLFLNARQQTIHSGWLTEIFDIMREEWKEDYANSCLATSADSILPESDNASSLSIKGKKPLSDEDVYYPRTDLRIRMSEGLLQKRLVARKAEQIADDIRRTSLQDLLAEVEVTGLGVALSGQSVNEFLAGLSEESEERVAFPPDLISDQYASKRLYFPEVTLPPLGTTNTDFGQIKVQPGVELTVAAWRVEFSGPLHPLEILRGFDKSSDTSVVGPTNGPSVV